MGGGSIGSELCQQIADLGPGEKLYEELFYENEEQEKTKHEKILLAKHTPTNWQSLINQLNELEKACNNFDKEKINSILNKLVPQHIPIPLSDSNVSNIIQRVS